MPRTRYIKTKDEARVFAYFLAKELLRHKKDCEDIIRDLRALEKKWGVVTPDVSVDEWVEP